MSSRSARSSSAAVSSIARSLMAGCLRLPGTCIWIGLRIVRPPDAAAGPPGGLVPVPPGAALLGEDGQVQVGELRGRPVVRQHRGVVGPGVRPAIAAVGQGEPLELVGTGLVLVDEAQLGAG